MRYLSHRTFKMVMKTKIRMFSSTKIEPVELSFKEYTDAVSPLLIFHGLCGSKVNFSSFCVKYLRTACPSRTVYSADLRNHGLSPHSSNHTYEHLAADIRAMVSEIQAPQVALMGHSMGGRAVMLYSLHYPDLVERLIVIDISPLNVPDVLLGARRVLQAIQKAVLPENITHIQALRILDEQLAPEIKNKWYRAFLLTNLEVRPNHTAKWRLNLDALIDEFPKYRYFPDVTNLKYTGPVLFVIGEKSVFFDRSMEHAVLETFPNADFVYIENAGHVVHIDNPKRFLEVCSNFLNKS